MTWTRRARHLGTGRRTYGHVSFLTGLAAGASAPIALRLHCGCIAVAKVVVFLSPLYCSAALVLQDILSSRSTQMSDAFPQSGHWNLRNGTIIRRIYSASHIDYPCHESWQMMNAVSNLNLLQLAWVVEADTAALPLDPTKNTSL
jgi:hypothetical protein